MKKRIIALLCAAVLCLSMVPVQAINAGDVYFAAVNDYLVPLTMDTMPTWVNGMLYVPAAVFDSAVTGANLGVYCNQSSTNNTITLYSLRRMLVFDMSRGVAYDYHSGEHLPSRAINRNGRIYLPVEMVCDFFGLEDTYNYTRYGYLVRIKSEAAWLNDADFMDAASGPMSGALQEILRQQQTKPQDPPPPVQQEPVVEQPEPKNRAQLCLGFRCETGEGLERILDRLDREGIRGMFFVAAELLTQRDDLIRRIVGSGHGIGLLAEEGSELAQLNRVLAHVVHTAATAALVPDGQLQALEQEGWVCWKQTVSGLRREKEGSAAYAQRILRTLSSRRGTVYLTLDDSTAMAEALPVLLQQLEQEEYTFITPLETRL